MLCPVFSLDAAHMLCPAFSLDAAHMLCPAFSLDAAHMLCARYAVQNGIIEVNKLWTCIRKCSAVHILCGLPISYGELHGVITWSCSL